MRILVVEEDVSFATELQDRLAIEEVYCHTAATEQEALEKLRTTQYNAVLLVHAFKQDALRLLETIRSAWHMPVIIMFDATTIELVVQAFSRGADDCVLFSIDPRELAARIRAAVRRCHGAPVPVLDIPGGQLNMTSRAIYGAGGSRVPLTLLEFRVFEALALQKGIVCSRQALKQYAYRDPAIADRTIDVHIRRVRKKMGASIWENKNYIETVRSGGYALRNEPVRTVKQ